MKRAWQILTHRKMINERDTSVTVKTNDYKQMKRFVLLFVFSLFMFTVFSQEKTMRRLQKMG